VLAILSDRKRDNEKNLGLLFACLSFSSFFGDVYDFLRNLVPFFSIFFHSLRRSPRLGEIKGVWLRLMVCVRGKEHLEGLEGVSGPVSGQCVSHDQISLFFFFFFFFFSVFLPGGWEGSRM
jgi:hypothetical protein